MVIEGTRLTHHPELGLWVKHEEESCPGGPHFSKTRGVFAHLKRRPEPIIGVLDTSHSQGGWAVAKACYLLQKHCLLYYPVRKGHEFDALQPQQRVARDLGAELVSLKAGRSAVLYHRAKRLLAERSGYMMPNALKLPESVDETAREFARTKIPPVKVILVSASSGTIAAGVIRAAGPSHHVIVHLGYSRPEQALRRYLRLSAGAGVKCSVEVVDEGYAYADQVKVDLNLPFPANPFYDKKAVYWWLRKGRAIHKEALLWLIG